MKSIDALRALQNLPSSVKWNTYYFDCYEDARGFCDELYSEEAVIVQVRPIAGHCVLVTQEPLGNWCEDAPIYDGVIINPDGYKLNDFYIYMLDD